jgi:signal peptidase I
MIFKKILLLSVILISIISVGNLTGCSKKDTKQITYTDSGMNETLQSGDILTISLLPYTPKQFDIIAIQLPEHETPLISRIIALEGQTVDFDFEDWIVYVDEEILDEPYILYQPDLPLYKYDINPDTLPIKIEPGKIFVMGDNRDRALDSRAESIGQVDVEYIIGNVIDVEFIVTKPIIE